MDEPECCTLNKKYEIKVEVVEIRIIVWAWRLNVWKNKLKMNMYEGVWE